MSQVKMLVHHMSCLSGRANDSSLQTESTDVTLQTGKVTDLLTG